MAKKSRDIGIFGGTFNPVHRGHLAIAKSFLRSGHIDTLWILLNPAPPHKTDEKLASCHARLKMLQAVFASIKNTVVSDLETRLPAPAYTIQTLRYLVDLHPNDRFHLCMGKDSLVSFKQWHQWQKILQYADLLVAARPLEKQYSSLAKELLAQVTFIEHIEVDISSTQVREKIVSGTSVDDLVPASVINIIEQEQLYR